MWENEVIRYADIQDLPVLKENDKHISEAELRNIIPAKRIFVMHQGDTFIGWLRFGSLWDNIPFINMLYISDGYRGKGYGTELVSFWEKEMAKEGYSSVLTSTQSNERAQFFYRKIGYTECGALLIKALSCCLAEYEKVGMRPKHYGSVEEFEKDYFALISNISYNSK